MAGPNAFTPEVTPGPVRSRPAVVAVGILLVAGFFDAISGNPVDAVLLAAVAVALWRHPGDPASAHPDEPSTRYRFRFGVAAAAGVVAYATAIAGFDRYSWAMTVAVLVPGVTATAVAWTGRRRRDPGPPLLPRQVIPWITVALLLAVFELVNLLLQPGLTVDSYDHPTLSVLWEATNGGLGDLFALLGWLGLGVYLLDR